MLSTPLSLFWCVMLSMRRCRVEWLATASTIITFVASAAIATALELPQQSAAELVTAVSGMKKGRADPFLVEEKGIA